METKVEAWRLVTQENLSQTEVARRLGIHQSSVSRYVADGRVAETYVIAFAKADLRKDVAFMLRQLIAHWMKRMHEAPDYKLEIAASTHLADLLAKFATLMGLNEPARVAIGLDDEAARKPDPRMVAAIEAAQKDNRDYLDRIRAGLPGWPTDEEESA